MTRELSLSIRPDWTEMVSVNEQSHHFLDSVGMPSAFVDTFTMVSCELMENGIKYGGRHGERLSSVDLVVTVVNEAITVQVKNIIGKGSRHHLRQLDRTLQWVRGFQDPFQAYIERVKEISKEPANHGKSGLGIVRIAYEARAAIDFVVGEDSVLSVSAVAKLR